jgi:hypothetical protein
MFNALNTRKLVAALAAVLGACEVAAAQYQQNKSYSDYYREQYQTTRNVPKSAMNYTIDKYYYHNKNISPYLNLVRPTSSFNPRYQSLVEPEVQRRANQQQAARRPTPNFSSSPTYGGGGGGAKPAYRDHWYGGLLTGP